ncbi:MAG: GAF domain-containing protein [Deltaproteobacteria bacterium]|nr:GAF domain-containing protein [Deltaproteobacteria bacterium]
MKKQLINYETLTRITGAIAASREPDEIVLMTVESVKTALEAKGCTLFLIDRQTDQLEIAGSYGLSQEYLDKGPISALQSIAATFKEGPVAIYDVADDPRIQYPEAALKEGIASILSVPIHVHDHVIGALRVYTSEPWEFTMEDVNFVQAVAQITGMAIDLCRLNKGYKYSIEILKTMRDPKYLKAV